MDISITKQKSSLIKRYWAWAIVMLIIVFTINYLWFLGQADFVIDKDIVVYDQVKRGDFTVSVRGTGLLIPDNIQWLSANVEARDGRFGAEFWPPPPQVSAGAVIVIVIVSPLASIMRGFFPGFFPVVSVVSAVVANSNKTFSSTSHPFLRAGQSVCSE